MTISTLHHPSRRLAKLWIDMLTALATLTIAGIVSIILGFNALPQSVPLFTVIHRYPAVAITLGLIVAIFSYISWRTIRSVEAEDDAMQGAPTLPRHTPLPPKPSSHRGVLRLSLAVSTASFGLFVALLATVLVRPTWCPDALCPTFAVAHQANSAFDSNVELYPTGLQTDAYALPGQPTSYTTTTAPQQIGVERTDLPNQVYRVGISMHNERTSGYAIIIESVAATLTGAQAPPEPLNVWQQPTESFISHPFLAPYHGELAGDTLEAASSAQPPERVLLSPGETDTIGLQIRSLASVDLHFQVVVRYRFANASTIFQLTLPHSYDVIFTDATNWHPYQLQGGAFRALTPHQKDKGKRRGYPAVGVARAMVSLLMGCATTTAHAPPTAISQAQGFPPSVLDVHHWAFVTNTPEARGEKISDRIHSWSVNKGSI